MKFIAGLILVFTAPQSWGAPVSMDYVYATRSGGDSTTSVPGESALAFQQPSPALTESEIARHLKGDILFGRGFSSGPDSDLTGLGPVFNNNSCTACHARDGRGALPLVPPGQEWVMLRQNESIFLRISVEDGTKTPRDEPHGWGGPIAVPGFSTQLFHLGSFGVRKDFPGVGQARVWMKHEFSEFTYPDGKKVVLRKPIFKITDAYDPRIYSSDVKTSPRMGTPMIGLGLLEAIREEDILALAARDLSEEGVHGKPNYVFDVQKKMRGDAYPVSLGRFGLKANTPSVFHQSLGALNGDLGVTNYAFPIESIFGTALYESLGLDKAPAAVEAKDQVADDLVFYSETLGVPERRHIDDPIVIKGAEVFHQVNCTSCHQPSFTTGVAKNPAFSNQKIYPFTDMLLHDMGDGLADGRQDFEANGRQWKTRPLWGLGHTQTINPRAGFLHDGRARTLEEAILWHDGEARYSKTKFTQLPLADREALIKFLRSL
ncbi:thiol oxidoreductase [Bdellovibrio bacteriovorus]|uniref:Thiol oxidoreductase n=1 Tax=Bdellovibrio bacteriovorus TaxID=959 RepID=A0A150WMI8_BDEBC|nr:di-heme oxidoredictase family protein [Bdellovibrio bacteriovorus]KYG65499.1 thiol oxidoreductase [Bdellovibrio bacteriovorus]